MKYKGNVKIILFYVVIFLTSAGCSQVKKGQVMIMIYQNQVDSYEEDSLVNNIIPPQVNLVGYIINYSDSTLLVPINGLKKKEYKSKLVAILEGDTLDFYVSRPEKVIASQDLQGLFLQINQEEVKRKKYDQHRYPFYRDYIVDFIRYGDFKFIYDPADAKKTPPIASEILVIRKKNSPIIFLDSF
ncbi:hypothetical protein [uncultured Microscilla sp.]|uniref:hypothetical protein n=1 Tax=uncultured Microscilla sp. TaxID=432653 RepID=UPI002627FC5D|nr:hypothetical protein [uncultured Microscilla sp.]